MIIDMYSILEFGDDVLYMDIDSIEDSNELMLLLHVNDDHDDFFKVNRFNSVKLASQLETIISSQFISEHFNKEGHYWSTVNYHDPDDEYTAIEFDDSHYKPFKLYIYPYIDEDTGEPKYFIKLANCDWRHADTNVFFDPYSWIGLKCSFTEVKIFAKTLEDFSLYCKLSKDSRELSKKLDEVKEMIKFNDDTFCGVKESDMNFYGVEDLLFSRDPFASGFVLHDGETLDEDGYVINNSKEEEDPTPEILAMAAEVDSLFKGVDIIEEMQWGGSC